MNNDALAFVVGIGCGITISILINMIPQSYTSQATHAVEQCEAALPRSQHCIITAIPAQESKQ